MDDTYKCKRCGDEWGFFPEDYECEEDMPKICPLCEMPATQMIKDVWREERFWGIPFIIKSLFLRLWKTKT